MKVLQPAVGVEPARRRDDSLDGIGALAAVWVFLVHAGYSGLTIAPAVNLKGAGRGGVLLFFFLSAFLLARPFFEDRRRIRSARAWAIFFARRIFRILPLYWFVLVVELLLDVGIFRDEPDRLALLVDHLTFQKGLSVFWSLLVEWRFYLVFPLIAVFAGAFLWMRRGLPVLGAVVVAWIAASATGLLSGLPATLWIDKHASVFVCGVLAAAVMASERTFAPRARLALEVSAWVLGIATIVLSMPSFAAWLLDGIAPSRFEATSADYERFWEQRIPWIGFLMAAFFFCYAHGRGPMRRLLSSRPLVEIGKFGFGIYLIHEPILRALASSPAVPREVTLLLTLVITILVAGMLFWVIEDPFIRWGQRLTRRLQLT